MSEDRQSNCSSPNHNNSSAENQQKNGKRRKQADGDEKGRRYIPKYIDPDKPEPCEVCGDRSSGYHYNVMTCEGCKGFFRRAVDGNKNFVCENNNECVINEETRTKCTACRMKKCLDVGMQRNRVLTERCRSNTQNCAETNYYVDINFSESDQIMIIYITHLYKSLIYPLIYKNQFNVIICNERPETISEDLKIIETSDDEKWSTIFNCINFAKPYFVNFATMIRTSMLINIQVPINSKRNSVIENFILSSLQDYNEKRGIILFPFGLALCKNCMGDEKHQEIIRKIFLAADSYKKLNPNSIELSFMMILMYLYNYFNEGNAIWEYEILTNLLLKYEKLYFKRERHEKLISQVLSILEIGRSIVALNSKYSSEEYQTCLPMIEVSQNENLHFGGITNGGEFKKGTERGYQEKIANENAASHGEMTEITELVGIFLEETFDENKFKSLLIRGINRIADKLNLNKESARKKQKFEDSDECKVQDL